MRMSLMIKSDTAWASLTSASTPLRAVVISNPAVVRYASSARKRFGSSSTINKRFDIFILLGYPLLVIIRPPRQPDRKRAPRTDLAFDRDPSAELLDETTHHV